MRFVCDMSKGYVHAYSHLIKTITWKVEQLVEEKEISILNYLLTAALKELVTEKGSGTYEALAIISASSCLFLQYSSSVSAETVDEDVMVKATKGRMNTREMDLEFDIMKSTWETKINIIDLLEEPFTFKRESLKRSLPFM
ncbi:uncharacterized protein A4U43_C01F22520 [Asparagus officinalis]|uniref:Uncharacterized protein n=1 Tax=Asparagus officinalis TaxID=4686 RepID=A0A5P1FRB4_ASPOF|nr:uncharacterized protein A4U43_C01F22520 [Asparagus officinalis]